MANNAPNGTSPNRSDGAWETITDLDGNLMTGPWTFVTDDRNIYPGPASRFVHVETGEIVFLHAVRKARPVHPPRSS